MRLGRFVTAQIGLLLVATLAITPLATAKTAKKTTSTKASSSSNSRKSSSSKSKHKKHTKYAKRSWKTKGQRTIDSERTRQIQEALIREHYMDGQADGVWDSRTQEACRKYQQANGWQTKVLPDSRALIKLGLGPDHSQVLNPETAAVSPFQPGGGEKPVSAAGIAPGNTVVRNQR